MTTQVERRPNGGPPAEGQPACNARKNGWADRVPKEDPGPWVGEGYCKKPPGWGTDHDRGRCRLHGGNAAVKHGLYSTVKREQLGRLIDQYMDDPEPLALNRELAIIRGLLEDYLASQEEPDPDTVTKLASEVSKIVKRIEDVRAQSALSLKELRRLMMEMGRVVTRHVDDQDVVDAIRSDWQRIRL